MQRLLVGLGLLALTVIQLCISSLVCASTLTLHGRVEARARTASGFFISDTDAKDLASGPPGSISDFRAASAHSSYPLHGSTVESLADALYQGEARFGELRGMAEAGAIAGTAFAQLTVGWEDDFRIISSTLPFGTPVDLRYSLFLESGLFSNQSCDGVSPPGPAIAQAAGWHGAAGIISNRACGPPEPQSVVTIIHTTIGALLNLSGELNVGASVGSSVVSRLHNMASADAFNTAHFYVDPVGANFSYITSSGVTYVTPAQVSPVPEPSTWFLLATGTAGLLGYGWWRRQVTEGSDTTPRAGMR